MKVQDFTGAHQVSTDSGIDSQLAARSAEGFNHFWLSDEAALYPLIGIFANRELACIHYFPREQHPGFHSVGPAPGLDPNGVTVFLLTPRQEKGTMPNHTVVPFSWAVAVAKEFARSPTLPRCIEWSEL